MKIWPPIEKNGLYMIYMCSNCFWELGRPNLLVRRSALRFVPAPFIFYLQYLIFLLWLILVLMRRYTRYHSCTSCTFFFYPY